MKNSQNRICSESVNFAELRGVVRTSEGEDGIAERHAVGARKRNGEEGGARARNK